MRAVEADSAAAMAETPSSLGAVSLRFSTRSSEWHRIISASAGATSAVIGLSLRSSFTSASPGVAAKVQGSVTTSPIVTQMKPHQRCSRQMDHYRSRLSDRPVHRAHVYCLTDLTEASLNLANIPPVAVGTSFFSEGSGCISDEWICGWEHAQLTRRDHYFPRKRH